MKQTIHLILFCAVLAASGCTAGGADDWKELREQANELYNAQQYHEALATYEQALSKADADGRLTLRQDIVDCHLALGDDTEARTLLGQLVSAAHESGNAYAEAEASFALGEQLYDAGDHKAGYDYMNEAVRLMEQSGDEQAPATLAYYHSRLMRFLGNEEQYAAAIEASERLVQAARQIADSASVRTYLRQAYAVRAYLYQRADSLYPPQVRLQQADSAYAAWRQLLPCEKLNEEDDICPYYIESGRYRQALEIYLRYEQYVLETMGYWSAMEQLVCRNQAEAYGRMGMPDSAYNRLMNAYEICDTLHARQAEANAQELEAVYQNQRKSEQIGRLRLWVNILGGLLAVLSVVTLVIRMRRLREQKNLAIVKMAKEMVAPPSSPEEDTIDPNIETIEAPSGVAWRAARFAAFDRTVEQGRLYTQSDLSREILADLMGVDRTTFSRIIQEQSGCKNLRDYLNQKRMRLAEELLCQHPDYTIEAIARDCGLGLTTFKRLCKEMHGMSPSDYRMLLRQQS